MDYKALESQVKSLHSEKGFFTFRRTTKLKNVKDPQAAVKIDYVKLSHRQFGTNDLKKLKEMHTNSDGKLEFVFGSRSQFHLVEDLKKELEFLGAKFGKQSPVTKGSKAKTEDDTK